MTGSMSDRIRPNVIRSILRPQYPIRINSKLAPTFPLDQQRSKMEWTHKHSYFTPRPEWSITMQAEQIYTQMYYVFAPLLELLGHDVQDSLEIVALSTSNLDYRKETKIWNYLFRTALPVDPYFKTESDVATIEIARHFTSIPVPIMYAYDSSADNALGFEWILMEENRTGRSLADSWNELDLEQKTTLTETLAEWNVELSQICSDMIGSIYLRYTASDMLEFFIGRAVNFHLTQQDRLFYKVDRGPFCTLQDYYAAVLEAASRDVARTIDSFESSLFHFQESKSRVRGTFLDPTDPLYLINHQHEMTDSQLEQDRSDELQYLQDGIQALTKALPTLSSKTGTTQLRTFLAHFELSMSNILVNETGTPVTLLGWEDIYLRPLLFLTDAPKYLQCEKEEFHEPEDMFSPVIMQSISDVDEKSKYLIDRQESNRRRRNNECTKLLQVYRKKLRDLQSPLADAIWENFPAVERELVERVLFLTAQAESHVEWVEENLGS